MDRIRLKMAFLGDSLTEGIVGASYFEILKKRLSRHDLFNYGKGGDTVVSLLHRLRQTDLEPGLDIGFLWVGVNDVLVKTRWSYPFIKRLRGQPWARNHPEFRECFDSILGLLQDRISHIFTLSPLFIGEDRDNEWNMELAVLSKIIQDLSGTYPNAEFIGWGEDFTPRPASINTPPYIPKNALRIILDAVLLRDPEEMEKTATKRGLRFTIDGVHLNNAGAEKVAAILLEKIRSKFPFVVGDV